DVAVEARRTGAGKNDPNRNLQGALTFLDCAAVQVAGASLTCAAGPDRRAACPTARATQPARAGSVRVRHCDLAVGHLQVGLLLVNVARAQVEDNALRVNPQGNLGDLGRQAENKRSRAALRKLLVANA